MGAAWGNRTHDLRITRTPPPRSHRSTSTDSTPHSSEGTEGAGRTHFVSHGLSHDASHAPGALLAPGSVEVGVWVFADQLGVKISGIGRRYGNFLAAVDHMAVRQNETIRRKDEP